MPDPSAAGVVTFTCFRYAGLRNKIWAMSQMQRAIASLEKVPGLQFFKLLGTGRRFHFLPNFSEYGLIGVWQDQAHAQLGLHTHPAFQKFTHRSEEQFTLYLQNYQTHG